MLLRPICLDCMIEMRVVTNGVIIVEMAYDPPEPYNIYKADLYQCPICSVGKAIVLANAPFWHHGDPIKEMPNIDDPEVFPVYETVEKAVHGRESHRQRKLEKSKDERS